MQSMAPSILRARRWFLAGPKYTIVRVQLEEGLLCSGRVNEWGSSKSLWSTQTTFNAKPKI